MAAVETDDGSTFRVELGEVGSPGLLGRLFAGRPRSIDPYTVALAVRLVMRECRTRSANGARLVWNEYRLFLCPADYESLRALEGRLARDMAPVLIDELRRRKAEVVGDLSLRLAVDEDGQLRPGLAVIRPAFVELAPNPVVVAGEMTVRIGGASSSVYPSAPRADSTVRVGAEGTPTGGARLTWPSGQATLEMGLRVTIGRPHDDPGGRFIALAGASSRINKQQAWIEVAGSELRVGRFSTANPVTVNGRLVQPGGEIGVDGDVARIDLSNGELLLELQRSGD